MNIAEPQSRPFRGRLFLILPVVLAILAVASIVRADRPAQFAAISVVTKSIPPFVFTDQDEPRGFSIDLWRAIALEAGLDYNFTLVDTVTDQLEAVANGDADAAIAAITITEEREIVVDFSQPYYRSGLGILTVSGGPATFGEAALSALSTNLLRVILFLFIIMIVMAHLIWLLERNRNPDFHSSYFRGVWDGLWWAAVTLFTVGYGDKTPRGMLGRALAIIWMFAGLFVVVNLTATVTAGLTTAELRSSIDGPEDLKGKPVATVAGSTADQWLQSQGIVHETTTTIEESYDMLLSGTAQAVVYDYPVLQYYVLNSGNPGLMMAGESFNSEMYGIAFPPDSPYRERVNIALLRVIESGTYEAIHVRWFGSAGGQ
jgi:ABC-type amino acid transport substrate-binding protein